MTHNSPFSILNVVPHFLSVLDPVLNLWHHVRASSVGGDETSGTTASVEAEGVATIFARRLRDEIETDSAGIWEEDGGTADGGERGFFPEEEGGFNLPFFWSWWLRTADDGHRRLGFQKEERGQFYRLMKEKQEKTNFFCFCIKI